MIQPIIYFVFIVFYSHYKCTSYKVWKKNSQIYPETSKSGRTLCLQSSVSNMNKLTNPKFTVSSSPSSSLLDESEESVILGKNKDGPISIVKALQILESETISSAKASMYIEGILIHSTILSPKQWNRLLDICIKFQFFQYAQKVFQIAIDCNLPYGTYHMNKLLTFLCSQKFHESYHFFEYAITKGYVPTSHNFTPLLRHAPSEYHIFVLLMMMESFNIQPNVISYTAAIKSCDTTHNLQTALDIIEIMRINNVYPNEITYSCLIGVATRCSAGQVALSILREMHVYKYPPNNLAYAGALYACAKSSMWTEVENLLHQMDRMGMPLEETVLISLIGACKPNHSSNTTATTTTTNQNNSDTNSVQWQRALWLLDTYLHRTNRVTDSLFTMTMNVCEAAKQFDAILSVYDKMMSYGLSLSKSSLGFVLRAYEHVGSIQKAISLFEYAKKTNLISIPIYRTIIRICNANNNDYATRASGMRYFSEMIYLPNSDSRYRNNIYTMTLYECLWEEREMLYDWFHLLNRYQSVGYNKTIVNDLIDNIHMIIGNISMFSSTISNKYLKSVLLSNPILNNNKNMMMNMIMNNLTLSNPTISNPTLLKSKQTQSMTLPIHMNILYRLLCHTPFNQSNTIYPFLISILKINSGLGLEIFENLIQDTHRINKQDICMIELYFECVDRLKESHSSLISNITLLFLRNIEHIVTNQKTEAIEIINLFLNDQNINEKVQISNFKSFQDQFNSELSEEELVDQKNETFINSLSTNTLLSTYRDFQTIIKASSLKESIIKELKLDKELKSIHPLNEFDKIYDKKSIQDILPKQLYQNNELLVFQAKYDIELWPEYKVRPKTTTINSVSPFRSEEFAYRFKTPSRDLILYRLSLIIIETLEKYSNSIGISISSDIYEELLNIWESLPNSIHKPAANFVISVRAKLFHSLSDHLCMRFIKSMALSPYYCRYAINNYFYLLLGRKSMEDTVGSEQSEIKSMIRSMIQSIPIDISNYAIYAIGMNGRDIILGELIVKEMIAMNYSISSYTITSLMAGYANEGNTEKVLYWFEYLYQNRNSDTNNDKVKIRILEWTYMIAIISCAKVNRWDEVMRLYQLLESEKGNHNHNHYECIDITEINKSVNSSYLFEWDTKDINYFQLRGLDSSPIPVPIDILAENPTEENRMSQNNSGLLSKGFKPKPKKDRIVKKTISQNSLVLNNTTQNKIRWNIITYNILIEVLAVKGYIKMVDKIYEEAMENSIVTPIDIKHFGIIDIQNHSISMSKAAIRYLFELIIKILSGQSFPIHILSESNSINMYKDSLKQMEVKLQRKLFSAMDNSKSIQVVIGQRKHVLNAIQTQLRDEYFPSIRSFQSDGNKLTIPGKEIRAWVDSEIIKRSKINSNSQDNTGS